jgi:hypothetical protein
MKRPATDIPSKRTGDVRKDLTQTQLAWIGSVALAYNENELLLDMIVGLGFGAVLNSHELTSRINGVEGKVALAKIGADALKAGPEFKRLLAETLGEGGFSLLKKLRDRIIHARIIDAAAAIARSPAQRGKFDEILLTEESLAGVYHRLDIIRYELMASLKIVGDLWIQASTGDSGEVARSLGNGAIVDRHRLESEARIAEALSQLQQRQRDRLSLPPLPEFPDQSELSAVDAQAAQDRQAEIFEGIPLANLPQRLSAATLPPTLLETIPPSPRDGN